MQESRLQKLEEILERLLQKPNDKEEVTWWKGMQENSIVNGGMVHSLVSGSDRGFMIAETGVDGSLGCSDLKVSTVLPEVCCICLAKYENNDELRELPCSHLFHKDCVDKWLKINALCPLCKSDVGENLTGSVSGEDASQQRGESRVENGLTNTSV
ncbi:hypothetical protein JHK85_048780 [Glycine max]|nr:hypothetical protein JHK85_048780 [Glycine max]